MIVTGTPCCEPSPLKKIPALNRWVELFTEEGFSQKDYAKLIVGRPIRNGCARKRRHCNDDPRSRIPRRLDEIG